MIITNGVIKLTKSLGKMLKLIYILFFIVLFCLVQTKENFVKIKTPLGKIKGYFKTSENGEVYAAYEGIPYALPPVGDLRFEPPQPVTAWNNELIATKLSDQCIQMINKFDSLSGFMINSSEDCLYLNIYVPKQKNNTTLPVIFWIHGGAFTFGMPNIFNVEYIMNKDIILVTFNYRLGPLGFLSTEDDQILGNMGLKDQSMALKWIHKNIKYFGGNPRKVTLIGLGAGGASVHYHYLSQMSSGLFQNGISISGTALNSWALTKNPLVMAKKLGQYLKCPNENTKELSDCLKKLPAKDIVQFSKKFSPLLYKPFTPFGPVIEKKGDAPFINRLPEEILQRGDVEDVPWITSVTSQEGLYLAAEFVNYDELFREPFEKDKEELSSWAFLLDFDNEQLLEKNKDTLTTKIKDYYNYTESESQKVKTLVQVFTDKLFAVDARKAVHMQAKVNENSVYFYVYNFKITESLSSIFSGIFRGVGHGDDASLLFKIPYLNFTKTDADKTMQNNLSNLWVSYAERRIQKYIPDWEKISSSENDFQYLHILGPDKHEVISDKNFGNTDFWKKFDDEYDSMTANIKEEL